jgi:hypothetical protein
MSANQFQWAIGAKRKKNTVFLVKKYGVNPISIS